ncbi:hypothetical protein K1719_020720 [Acacia pycnantha]|nr:hypothetical protein K1719_020720 [Acacia pycnantha]
MHELQFWALSFAVIGGCLVRGSNLKTLHARVTLLLSSFLKSEASYSFANLSNFISLIQGHVSWFGVRGSW